VHARLHGALCRKYMFSSGIDYGGRRVGLSIFFFKGTVSRDFLLLVFFMNQFPQALEYTIRAVSNFFENSRRYLQLKVDHRCQRHRWQICHRYRRQILPPVSVVLLIPVANLLPVSNLPPVSATPVANNEINIRLRIPYSELESKNLCIC
jgi:hypothetical protein